jgi:hypothetical protein
MQLTAFFDVTGLAADASDPNTLHPEKSTSAVLRTRAQAAPKLPCAQGDERGDPKLGVFALNGTTMSVIPWVLEEATGIWLPLIDTAAAVAVTPAKAGFITVPRMQNPTFFLQLTVVTTVTKYGWIYC